MQWEIAIGLIIAGAILMGMEVYVYGFVLGTVGFLLQLIAAVMFFRDLEWHLALLWLAGTVILDAGVVYLAVKYFPKTGLGKKMVLQHTQQIYKSATGDDSLQGFVGKEGVAESLLRPTGTALVDGRRVDVVTEGEFLERGTKVKVVAIKEAHLVVRKLS